MPYTQSNLAPNIDDDNFEGLITQAEPRYYFFWLRLARPILENGVTYNSTMVVVEHYDYNFLTSVEGESYLPKNIAEFTNEENIHGLVRAYYFLSSNHKDSSVVPQDPANLISQLLNPKRPFLGDFVYLLRHTDAIFFEQWRVNQAIDQSSNPEEFIDPFRLQLRKYLKTAPRKYIVPAAFCNQAPGYGEINGSSPMITHKRTLAQNNGTSGSDHEGTLGQGAEAVNRYADQGSRNCSAAVNTFNSFAGNVAKGSKTVKKISTASEDVTTGISLVCTTAGLPALIIDLNDLRKSVVKGEDLTEHLPTMCALCETVLSYSSDGLFIAARVTSLAPLSFASSALGLGANVFEWLATAYEMYKLNGSKKELGKCVDLLEGILFCACNYMWHPQLQSLYNMVVWLKRKFKHRFISTGIKLAHLTAQIGIGVAATVVGALIIAGVGGATMGIGAAVIGGLGAGLAFGYLGGTAAYQFAGYSASVDAYKAYKKNIRFQRDWKIIDKQVADYEEYLFDTAKGVNRFTHLFGKSMGDYALTRVSDTVISMKYAERNQPEQFTKNARMQLYKMVVDVVAEVIGYDDSLLNFSDMKGKKKSVRRLANSV